MLRSPKVVFPVAAVVLGGAGVAGGMLIASSGGSSGAQALAASKPGAVIYSAPSGPASPSPAASGLPAAPQVDGSAHTVAPATSAGTLAAGSRLDSGQIMYSPNHQYVLAMQPDGNLVAYRVDGKQWLWSSQTASPGAVAVFQRNGDLVVYDTTGKRLWTSGTKGGAGSVASLQDDGDLVISDGAAGHSLWTSQQALSTLAGGQYIRPGHALYSPDHQYVLVMQTDGNLVLYSAAGQALWDTGTTGQNTVATFQRNGDFLVYSSHAHVLWNTRTRAATGAYVTVQDSGDVVLMSGPSGSVLWSTGTSGGRSQLQS